MSPLNKFNANPHSLLILFFLAVTAVSCSCDEAVFSTNINLFASAVITDRDYILLGDRGNIFQSNDAAKSWKRVESNTRSALVSVCFPDSQNGWAVGQDGAVLHSTDKGKTWAFQVSGVHTYLLAVDFFDVLNGCAVGADSTVIMTADGGKTWSVSPFRAPSAFDDDPDFAEEYNLLAVSMIDASQVCVAGDGGRIFVTRDAGRSWTDVKSPLYDEEMMEGRNLYAMTYDNGVLYAAGIDCTFICSKDQGNTWTIIDTGYTDPDLFAIDMIGGTGIAAGSGGHVFLISDRGKQWELLKVPEKTTRSWLSGLDLRKTGQGNIICLLTGQNGVSGLYKNGKFSW